MKVIASESVVAYLDEHGRRLFVWPSAFGCCGGVTRLRSSTEQPAGRSFRAVDGGQAFELYVPERLASLPDELVLDVRRFPRRVEAYWNGCAWIA